MKELSQFKLLNYFNKVKEIVETKDTFPITVEIDPINACNHRCVFCADNKMTRSSDRFSLEMINRLLSQLMGVGVKGIIYKGGGEPLLNPHMREIIEDTYRLGFKIAMLTNGSLITAPIARAIVDYMSYIRISLDATNAEDYYAWHRSHSYYTVLDNIKSLTSYKRSSGSKIKIGVNILYSMPTYKNLMGAFELACKLDIDVLSFRKAFIEPYGFKKAWTSEDDMDDYVAELRKWSDTQKWPFHVMFDASRGSEIEHCSESNLPYCLATPLLGVICADGGVYACCDLRGVKDYCYGNIYEETFFEIWKGEKRRSILTEKVIPKKCFSMCTHRFKLYNDLLNYLLSDDKPHVELI